MKETTTMHLYPEEYQIIKEVADKHGLTIPDSAKMVIGSYPEIAHSAQTVEGLVELTLDEAVVLGKALIAEFFLEIGKRLLEEKADDRG